MCLHFQIAPASIVLSPLTSLLCDVLKLTDPMATILERNAGAPSLDSSSRSRQDSAQCDSSVNTTFNPEEISLDSDEDSSTAATQDETEASTSLASNTSNEPHSLASKLAAIRPKSDATNPTETGETAEIRDVLEESAQDSTESSSAAQNVVRKRPSIEQVSPTEDAEASSNDNIEVAATVPKPRKFIRRNRSIYEQTSSEDATS